MSTSGVQQAVEPPKLKGAKGNEFPIMDRKVRAEVRIRRSLVVLKWCPLPLDTSTLSEGAPMYWVQRLARVGLQELMASG
jgi:hypothetical protein